MSFEQLQASGGSDVIIDLIEMSDGVETIRVYPGFVDIAVTLEDSTTATFVGQAVDIQEPQDGGEVVQSLSFSRDNIDGTVTRFALGAKQNSRQVTIKHRKYLASDLSAPVRGPFVYEGKSINWNATGAEIEGAYFNVLELAATRMRYDDERFPGVRLL